MSIRWGLEATYGGRTPRQTLFAAQGRISGQMSRQLRLGTWCLSHPAHFEPRKRADERESRLSKPTPDSRRRHSILFTLTTRFHSRLMLRPGQRRRTKKMGLRFPGVSRFRIYSGSGEGRWLRGLCCGFGGASLSVLFSLAWMVFLVLWRLWPCLCLCWVLWSLSWSRPGSISTISPGGNGAHCRLSDLSREPSMGPASFAIRWQDRARGRGGDISGAGRRRDSFFWTPRRW